MIAEGVKGLLMASSETLVVCALRREAESRRTWRGFGGFEIVVTGPALSLSVKDALN